MSDSSVTLRLTQVRTMENKEVKTAQRINKRLQHTAQSTEETTSQIIPSRVT